MEITTYRNSDMWIYRVVVTVLTFGAVFAGGHFLGRYLHEDEAYGIAKGDREPGSDGRIKIARVLAEGYGDTKGFAEFRPDLPGDASVRTTPHVVDKFAPIEGAVAAFLAFFLSAEAGRVWARKQAAHRAQGR